MHPPESEVKNAVDWIGGSIVTAALFILLFALTEGNIVGWSRPYIGAIIGVAVVLLVVFVFWQLYLEKKTSRRPLIKMSLYSNGRVVAAQLTMALFFTSFFNYLIFATFWFQDYQGLSKVQTMLRFLPTGPAGSKLWSPPQCTELILVNSHCRLRCGTTSVESKGELHRNVWHLLLHGFFLTVRSSYRSR